jgi:HAD superfamily hydrolase (TIGR01509 family)
MIRNIIWDLDGTLFDTYPAIARAFDFTLKEWGVSAPLDRIYSLAKIKLNLCASQLAEQFSLDTADVLAKYQSQYGAMPIADQGPFPGVIRVCERIHEKDGTNVIVTHRGRESTLKFLDVNGAGHLFKDVITRDEGFPEKPDPAAFLAMIHRHGFDPTETLAVGDREIDIRAGKAAGVRTCLFGDAAAEPAPDYCIQTFDDLGQILQQENGPYWT